MTLYKLIDMVRMRPELYLGHPSPTNLGSFIAGYSLASNSEVCKNEEPSFQGFHDWVASLFDYSESTTGWAYMIEDQREDKKEALYLFYELLDKYRGIHHKQLASVKYTHESMTDRTWRGYSRMKKVRGTFEAVPKPLPKKLIIRELEMEPPWFQLVALSNEYEILYLWSSTELTKVYRRARDIFGIHGEEWIIKSTNGI